MSRNIVRVNIHNRGKLFGLETPAYNVPLDYETYELFKEMGFNIEIAYPEFDNLVQTQKLVEPVLKEEKPQPKRPYKKRVPLSLDGFTAKDVYTEDELKGLSKSELRRIMNFRGYFGLKTGKREPLAPKYDDDKPTLIKKVLLTNLK